DIMVYFVGDGNLKPQITEALQLKGLELFCHITGFVPNELLLSFMHVSDLVIIPSIYEGFGNVAIEGLMTKSLMLTSDAGGLKEIMRNKENGFVFKALDQQSLLSQLEFIYNNRDKEIVIKELLRDEYLLKYSFKSHIM